MSRWPPRDRVLVFVDDLSVPVLDPDDRKHLEKSLRLRPGTQISVGDGRGSWLPVRLGADLEPLDSVQAIPVFPTELVIAVAPVKGDRTELIVQKATELGVDRLVMLETERTVVRWNADRRAKNAERFTRIAREAAMQSRNPWLPSIEPQQSLDDFFQRWPDALLADPDASQSLRDRAPVSTALAIGPEGGFSPRERHERPLVRLPGNILRTETAALAASVLLATLRGGRPPAS